MKASLCFFGLVAAGSVAGFAACSSSNGSSSGGEDAGPQDAGADATAPGSDDAGVDSATPSDAPAEATVTGMKIVTAYGPLLQANAGDAVQLQVVVTMSDGTTQPLPTTMTVSWTQPQTITAQNPDDAGASVIPDAGAQPTGFFVRNPYRTDRTDYPGTLFVINPGTAPDAGITVTAALQDGGSISAVVSVAPIPPGDPDAGSMLYLTDLTCAACHGQTAAGSPPHFSDDGGVFYTLPGANTTYPAPGLDDIDDGGGPNLAADPAWSASLFSMAAQGDIDNNGVALRQPMVDSLANQNDSDGGVLNAQSFADIYAWLKTQKVR